MRVLARSLPRLDYHTSAPTTQHFSSTSTAATFLASLRYTPSYQRGKHIDGGYGQLQSIHTLRT